MQKITPFFWFDSQAEEAMTFYTSIFDNSRIVSIKRYPDGPLEGPMAGMQGKVLTGIFELAGQQFMALDGGPVFQFNPSISMFVNCNTVEEVDALWARLSEDASGIMMPLQAYPFSEKYGWLADKYGLSWQLSVGPRAQKITPNLLFVGDQHGKAEEAMTFYASLFEDSAVDAIARYGPGEGGEEGKVKYAHFRLHGQEFSAMDSNLDHAFTFESAISFYVNCDTQEEIDHFWYALSAVPQAEQCGWLKDKYGVAWQIVPSMLPDLLNDPDPEKAGRATQAMLQMKKLDIDALEAAHAG